MTKSNEPKYRLHPQFKGLLHSDEGVAMTPDDVWHFPGHQARDLVRRFVLVEVEEEIKPKSRKGKTLTEGE